MAVSYPQFSVIIHDMVNARQLVKVKSPTALEIAYSIGIHSGSSPVPKPLRTHPDSSENSADTVPKMWEFRYIGRVIEAFSQFAESELLN